MVPAQRQILLDAVAAIADTLAAQWLAEEDAATLSATSVNALSQAGVFAMKLPAVLGGREADPTTQLLVLEALAVANPSASWCAMVGATAIGLPGAFLPEEGMARMFGGGRPPRGAIIAAPMGRTVPVDGGWQLTGRWAFVSGVRHADWIAVGAMATPEPGASPRHTMLVIPAASATIHDNWQVAGLKGTGSCDISVEGLFVSSAFAWDPLHGTPLRGGPLYRIALPGFVVNEHAGFALGTARRALNAFVGSMGGKRRGGAMRLAERPAVQHMLGASEVRLAAARALAIELNDHAWALVSSGEPVPQRLQVELRAIAVHCTEVAAEVITRVFRFAGGSAAYRESLLQQCLRDINVAAQHFQMSEIAYEDLGQLILG